MLEKGICTLKITETDDQQEQDDERSGTSSRGSGSNEITFHLNSGSFAASMSPIDHMDEEGNLPLTDISALLPAVLEEEEEEEEEDLVPFSLPPISPAKKNSIKLEEETLSTMGSESIKSQDALLPIKKSTKTATYASFESQTCAHLKENQSVAQEDEQRMTALIALKNVIFKQRSTIKRFSKEKKRASAKYVKCKSEKKEILKENASMRRSLKKLSKDKESLELEIRMLKEELTKVELQDSDSVPVKNKPPFVYTLLQLNDDIRKEKCSNR